MYVRLPLQATQQEPASSADHAQTQASQRKGQESTSGCEKKVFL